MLNATQKQELITIFENVMKQKGLTEIDVTVGSTFVKTHFPDTDLPDDEVLFRVFYSESKKKSYVVEPKVIRNDDGYVVLMLAGGTEIPLPKGAITTCLIKEDKAGNKYAVADMTIVIGSQGIPELKITFNKGYDLSAISASGLRGILKNIITSGKDTDEVLGTKSNGANIHKLWELPKGTYEGLVLQVKKGQYPKYYFEVDGVNYQVPNREAKYIESMDGTYSLEIPEDAEIKVGSYNGNEYKSYTDYTFIKELDFDSISEYC